MTVSNCIILKLKDMFHGLFNIELIFSLFKQSLTISINQKKMLNMVYNGPIAMYGQVRSDKVMYGIVRYCTVWCGIVRSGTVVYGLVLYCTVLYGLIRYCTV